MKSCSALRVVLSLGLLCVLGSMANVNAAEATWDGGSSVTQGWRTAENWVGDTVPTFDSSLDVYFNSAGAGNLTNYLGTASTIRSLNFTADADSAISIRLANILTGSTARNLTLGGAGGAAITSDAGAAGAITIGVAGGNVVLAEDLRLTHNGTGLMLFNRIITGAFAITNNGSGTVQFNSANTFSGGLVMNSGTLILGNNAALGTGALTIKGGSIDVSAARTTSNHNAQNWDGNFTYIGSSTWNTGTNTVTMNAARTVTVSASTLTVGGVLSGNDGSKDLNVFDVTKNGNGTLDFTNSAAITLRAGGQTNTVNNTGILKIAGAVSSAGGENVFDVLTKKGTGTLNLAGTGAELSSNQTVSVTGVLQLGGVVSDLAGTTNDLTVTSGTLQLDNANTYGGTTYVNSGTTLRLGAELASLGSTNRGTVVASGGSLRVQQVNMTNTENLVLSGAGVTPGNNNGALVFNRNTGTWLWDGKITLDSGATITGYGAGILSMTISQGIDGTGDLTLLMGAANNGNGVFYMNGQSTYTGNTYLALTNMSSKYAYIQLGTNNALPTTTILNMATENQSTKTNLAKVVLNGFNQQLAGLNSSTYYGSIQSNMVVNGSATAATLMVSNSVNTVFDGYLGGSETDENNFSLVKAGGGVLSLTGSSTYTNGTTVSGGVLNIATTGSLPGWNTGGAFSVAAGAAVAVGNTVSDANIATLLGTGNFAAGSGIGFDTTLGDRTYGNTLSGNMGLVKLGNNTLTLTADNSYTAGTVVGGGTLALGSAGALGTVGTITMLGGALQFSAANTTDYSDRLAATAGQAFGFDTAGQNITLAGALVSDGGSLTKSGAGTLTLAGTNTYTGTTTINSGTLEVTGLLGGGTYTGAITNDGTLVYAGATDQILQGKISGTGGLIKNGAATLTLGSAAETYTGDTIVNQGVLVVNAIATGDTLNANVTVKSNATLRIAGAGGSLGNDASVTVEEGGLFDVKKNDTMGGLSGAGVVEFSNNAGLYTLNLNANNQTTTFAGSIREIAGVTGAVNKAGTGTLTFTGAHTFHGDLRVSNGTLQIGDGGTTGTLNDGNVIVNTSGTLIFNRSNDYTVTNVISGGGVVQKLGVGALILSGANTYTNTTTVSAGTLVVNGSIAGGLIVDAGATLGGSGTVGGAVVVSGTHNPGNSPGIQTFNSNLTYNAGATVTWELAEDTATQGDPAVFDQIVVNEDLEFAGATTQTLVFNGAGSTVDWNDAFWGSSHQWKIFDVAEGKNLTGFDNLSLQVQDWQDGSGNSFDTVLSGATFALSQLDNDVMLNYTAIPEPAVISLMTLAGAGLMLRRKLKREM